MTDKEQIEALKVLVISLAKAYQSNYERFAASSNYSYEIKQAVPETIYKNIWTVFSHFATLQGSSYRDLIEEISTLSIPNKFPATTEQMVALFDYDKKSVRKALYEKKYSDKAKADKLVEIKKIWNVE